MLSDDASTPVYIEGGSGNRQVGLKPSVATYTTISAECDNTCSSLAKANVVVIAAQTTNNASDLNIGGGQDTVDECDVFEEAAMTHATVFRNTQKQSGLLTRCNERKFKQRLSKKPLPSQYQNLPASTRLF